MRNQFETQLAQLNNMLTEMGALVKSAIMLATQALNEQNTELAKRVIDTEQDINHREKDIETLCLRLLLQQQPVARDFHLVSAALKMITDIERIGDQAADISEITLLLSGTPYIKNPEHIPQMAEATIYMVSKSIEAFVKKDLQLAKSVIEYDDVVDNLFITVRRELINLIRIDKNNGEQAMDLLMVAKYYERIGDHAVNIAEWVVFSITGIHNKLPAIDE